MKNFTLTLLSLLLFAGNADAQMVISKVFYAGTTKKGATTNYTGGEEYIVLHNNTDKEADIAGYYIGLIESEGSTGAYLASETTNNDVKLKQVYQIPEDKPFVVAPWGDVVIAACAKDHSADAENGADLSKADFTFGNMNGDSESVPVLKLVFSFNANTKAVNLTNGGDAGIIIINKKNGDSKLTAADESTWVYANGKTTGSRYLPFNAYYAMDCVEILKTKAVDGVYTIDAARKRIKDSFDKGYVPADQKMNKDGYVAYRKTALNNEGKVLLYDTQNSCVDFAISNAKDVTEYDAVEAGLTEVKINIPESGYLPYNAEHYFITAKDVYLTYVNISGGNVKFNSYAGGTFIASDAPYVLVGAPGEHSIYYTEAQRTIATAGSDNWISDGDEKYKDGVLTVTTKNRFPMKFVNEKGNPHFQRDCVDGNNQTLKINVEAEGRFYINHTVFNEAEPTIAFGGVTPEEVIVAGIDAVVAVPTATTGTFNLQGIRMNGDILPRGIYVKDGKKFIVR